MEEEKESRGAVTGLLVSCKIGGVGKWLITDLF